VCETRKRGRVAVKGDELASLFGLLFTPVFYVLMRWIGATRGAMTAIAAVSFSDGAQIDVHRPGLTDTESIE
jgi:hypothetical protein